MKNWSLTILFSLASLTAGAVESAVQGREMPVVIKKVVPAYPATCASSGAEGDVIIEGLLTRQGELRAATVVSAPCPDLAQASLDAVRQWEFAPVLRDGEPAEVVIRVPVRFELNHVEPAEEVLAKN